MSKKDEWQQLGEGLLAGLRAGTVSVPYLFLNSYAKLGLTEAEAMLLMQLMAFLDKEKKEFPTIEELQSRMSAAPDLVIKGLQNLMKLGYLAIDEETDPHSGIRFERYNLDGLSLKLAEHWVKERKEAQKLAKTDKSDDGMNLFGIFEKEFARPLTPMELETIAGWIDQDGFHQELILAALKEAVFAAKVHFRYIDRILLDWKRNKVITVEQAKEHTQRFRGR